MFKPTCNVFWLTGISGAGKSTICQATLPLLEDHGLSVKILDGDELRESYKKMIGFTRQDVLSNNRQICHLIKYKFSKRYDVILVPTIAPYQEVRQSVADYLESKIYFIYCDTTVETAAERDTKGLYAKEKIGIISDLIGVSKNFPYEIPENPDFILHTNKNGDDQILSLSLQLFEFILLKINL